jgi:hypothetical protein
VAQITIATPVSRLRIRLRAAKTNAAYEELIADFHRELRRGVIRKLRKVRQSNDQA